MYQVLDVRLLKIPGTVEELAPLAREYGFDGLDVPEVILGDEKKAESAQAAMKENGLKWGLLPTPVDFFDETIDEIYRNEIMAAVLSLPDVSKEVLLLYGYVGYNVRDIAKYLKITEATAYKRLQRARSALAEKIGRRQGNDRNAASRNSMRCDG